MGKLLLQAISEDILKKHGIDPSADTYYLELPLENFTIGKVGEQILIKINDIVLAFEYDEGHWFPIFIENKKGKTTCSYTENGKRMIIPYRFNNFLLFQGIFAKNIKGLLENEVLNEKQT